MKALLFSALLLLVILVFNCFAKKKWNALRKVLVNFGIIIGFSALGLNALLEDSFGASTPVHVRIKNLTNKNLKIYSIAFWRNNWNESRNSVTYDIKLKSNEMSDFWFENDGTTEFWIVAKNENNEIEYLKTITEQKGEFHFKITNLENLDPNKIQIAKELTSEKDKSERLKKYAIWANIVLIGLLAISMVKTKNAEQ